MNPRYHSTGGVQLALAIYDQITFKKTTIFCLESARILLEVLMYQES